MSGARCSGSSGPPRERPAARPRGRTTTTACAKPLGEYLRSHGCDVLEATNGLEALLQVKRQRPAAVVLDLNMPRLGGIEALKRMRAFDPAMVVMIVTSVTDDRELRPAIRGARRAEAAALEAFSS
jgi:CheY-like chemotaxis protein